MGIPFQAELVLLGCDTCHTISRFIYLLFVNDVCVWQINFDFDVDQ